MNTEGRSGNTNAQHTHNESRQVQAEFLQGNMIDNAPVSMPGFPKAPGDECDGEGYAASIVHCLRLSVWHC